MFSVAVPMVAAMVPGTSRQSDNSHRGASPPAGQLLLAIWNVTPLVVPVMFGAIGPVQPDPAGPTLRER